MVQLCQGVKDAGWTILSHCQGDAAVDEYLDAIETVYGENPRQGSIASSTPRWRAGTRSSA